MIGKQEGDMVVVRITTPESAALSILPTDVPNYVDFWEVVFRNADKTAYYRGTGTLLSRNGIDVTVPIGNGYTVLLLGGHGETKTLLAFGIAEDQDIVANTANIVTVVLSKIAFQWNGDNLGIGANLTTAVATTATAAAAARGAATTARTAAAPVIAAADTARAAADLARAAAEADSGDTGKEAAAVAAEAAAAEAEAIAVAAEAAAATPEAEAVKAEATAEAAEAVAEAVAAEISGVTKADDFAFSGTLGLVPATITVKDKVVQFGKRDDIGRAEKTDVLKVTVNFSGLAGLADLLGIGDGIVRLEESSYISVQPRKANVYVGGIKKSISCTNGTSTYDNAITTNLAGLTFSLPGDGTVSFPRSNVDLVLDIVLRYRAFKGDSGTGVHPNTTIWNIANGIYGEPDDSINSSESALNGGIVIRLGKGSSETGQGQTTVVMDPRFTTGKGGPK
jgi:hypothetical protein